MLSAKTFPGIRQRTEPLPACPGTLKAQGVPRGTLKTPQEAEALNNPAPKEPPRSSSGRLPCSQWPHQTTRVSKREEEFCGWVASFVGLCCGFRWEGGDGKKSRVSGFRGPGHLLLPPSLPPSREEIFRAPVVLKGGGTGRDTEHSGSVKDSAELCLNSRMLLLGPLTPQTSEQTAFSATDSHKPL